MAVKTVSPAKIIFTAENKGFLSKTVFTAVKMVSLQKPFLLLKIRVSDPKLF